ncbi:MAG: hypothetical protein KGK07_13560 [Chloroflexota bacterium]|nr:hypothetical protein [Chloroflexota bacterium]
MAPDARWIQVYNPMGWGTNSWLNGTAPGAGVTLIPGGGADPVHPFAGAGNEYIVKMAAGSSFTVSIVSPPAAGATPAKRWGLIWSGIVWLTAYPASEALLINASNDPYQLKVTPAGTLRLYTGSGLPLVGTSTAALPTGQWVQLEVWEVYRDSAGNLLATKQWVVRTATLAAPPAYTTFLNVNANPSQNLAAGGFNAAWQAPALMYLCNVWGGWEDADSPMGVHRQDIQRPSVAKGVGHLNQWPGNPANVNEALPDDATTQDTWSNPGAATASQLYKLSDPLYITATDLTTETVCAGFDLYEPTPAKGVTNSLASMASNGTADTLNTAIGGTGAWVQDLWMLQSAKLNGGTVVPWTLAQLQGLQAGAQAQTNDSAVGNEIFHMSTVAVLVPYQKAGETGTALPAPVAPPSGAVSVICAVI